MRGENGAFKFNYIQQIFDPPHRITNLHVFHFAGVKIDRFPVRGPCIISPPPSAYCADIMTRKILVETVSRERGRLAIETKFRSLIFHSFVVGFLVQ